MQRSFIIASLFAVLLAGCSNPDASANGDTQMTPGKPQEGGKAYKIAFIPKGATHEFWKSMQGGADAAAAENNVELLWKAPLKEDDKAEQIKVVENFTAQKVDGIVLAPLDQEALRAPVKEAIAAGIPVIIVDSGLKDVETTSYIATDNYAAGKLGGARLASAVGKGARVIMLRYAEGSASTMEREKGFMDAAKEAGLVVVSEEQHAGATRESAQTASENLLARFKKGDG
ncbi:MAG TPA: substrate-binding domain-containing protein, partial [Fimbriimonas sp.]|nr:substrate-binding domain-containing protein [Fimbriimonas sp.]